MTAIKYTVKAYERKELMAEVERLKTANTSLLKTLVEVAIPLESMYISGTYKLHSAEIIESIEKAVRICRESLLIVTKGP